MSARQGKTKTKEMTWSEKDLAKHMLKDKDKKRASPAADGGSKSSLTVRQKQQSAAGGGGGGPKPAGRLSSTVPAKKGPDVRRGGKERLSSTATAASSSSSGSRGSGARERGERREEETRRGKDLSSQRSQIRNKEKREGVERREEKRRGDQREREGRSGGSRRGGEEAAKKERDRREKERRREGEKERGKEKEQREKINRDVAPPAGSVPQPMEEVRDGDIIEEDFEYEEDFEEDDYKDDFEEDIEEDTESESLSHDAKSPSATNPDPSSTDRINLVEIMQAIDAENKDVSHPPQLEPTHPSATEPFSSQGSLGSQRSMGHRKFVDFSSAKKTEEKERVARVTKKRGQELLAMIELDVVTFDLFELQPLSEYEVYMRSFGTAGTRQVGCQTGEDTQEEETQTEEVEGREKWVQWPPEDLKGYGGPDGEGEEAVEGDIGSAVRLTSFLKRASQVMSVLLEENSAQSDQSQTHSNHSQIPFCSTRIKIESPKELRGCTLTSVEYSHAHPHLVLTIHTPTQEEGVGPVPKGGGAICVWSTREPSQPQFLLVSQSPSVCGCFGPLKTPLVFSGTEDGSVLLWDLREAIAMHTRPPGVATPTCHTHIPRPPTFSTAALSQKLGHRSPIVSLSPITSSTPHTPHTHHLTNVTDESSATIGLSFQIASLDRSGLLIIWVAVETKPHPQGSESDLGLIPNGRVKLVWSAALDTVRSSPDSIPPRTLCVRFHSTDTNHLFVGTDEGIVLHRTRYSHRPIPRQYRSQTITHCPCDVTSLSFSPWQPDYFLASYSDGNISLYNIKKTQPLVTWSESTNRIAVSKVEWAWHHPGVFLALDQQSTIYLWNLMENKRGPTHIHKRGEGTPATFSFSVSPSSSSSSPSSPSFAVCLSSSTLEVHQLSSTVSDSETLEKQLLPNFTNYLTSL